MCDGAEPQRLARAHPLRNFLWEIGPQPWVADQITKKQSAVISAHANVERDTPQQLTPQCFAPLTSPRGSAATCAKSGNIYPPARRTTIANDKS